ncbi:MAG: ABC transporter substrate-binding protein [Mycobacterium leprae]
MSIKRTAMLLLTALLGVGLLAGCSSKPGDVYKQGANPAPAQQDSKPVTLKIGLLPFTEGLPYWVAQKNDYFKAQGVDVQLVKFQSANERDTAIMTGNIDGMVTDLMGVASMVGTNTAKVHVISVALGANQKEAPMGIVSAPNSGIKTAADLKGKEIAISTNTMMEYVASKLLAENGLTPSDVKFVSIPALPVRVETLLAGKVAAAILPDPLFWQTTQQGATAVLSNAKAKQNYYQSVLVMTDKAIAEKKDGIQKMLIAYNRGVLDIQTNSAAYKSLMVDNNLLAKEFVDKYNVVPFSVTQAPDKAGVESVVQWLLDKKILSSKVSYEQLVDTSLLPKTK